MYRKENNEKQIIISEPIETIHLLWLGKEQKNLNTKVWNFKKTIYLI